MPSHAVSPGPEARARRRLTRRQRRMDAWRRLPMYGLLWVCLQIVGLGEPRVSAVSLVLRILLAALITVLAVVAGLCLPARVRAWAGNAESPRPRWQYLLAAACALAVAGCFALLSSYTADLTMRVSAAAATWSGLYALVLIGRAASWGRVRALLWWRL